MSSTIDGVPSRPFVFEPRTPARAAPADSPDYRAPHPFSEVVRGVLDRIEAGERSVRSATTGFAGMDAAALIALQAGIYRYSEAVELAAKLADRTATAVRTVVQSGH